MTSLNVSFVPDAPGTIMLEERDNPVLVLFVFAVLRNRIFESGGITIKSKNGMYWPGKQANRQTGKQADGQTGERCRTTSCTRAR
ncbi:hypothetical protein SAMN06295900_12913 [Trinickia caryophylli]|uniref:Uncharacterized protein n=1 Tax=Trinickia caryophylli TaxID=28094 RepID=A0A1X7HBZ0_TRICW|nr:hypothetical protein SAMN06295900_12913 [Trinickia caryophylli]